MERTVEEIVKDTEKHCQILDRKRKILREVFEHVQRGGEPNAKWMNERHEAPDFAPAQAVPSMAPGLFPPVIRQSFIPKLKIFYLKVIFLMLAS
uniref:Uncharacterized protein n=1 Tax=Caenorhabditis tropicalis TaxID=1561998 RepID=A0A1I7U2Z6_9PELO